MKEMLKQPYFSELDSSGGEFDFTDDTADTFEFEETVEDTTPTEETKEEVQPEPLDVTPFLEEIGKKAKFNHEPRQPESLEEVIANYQKGMNYDKAVERAAQEARQQAIDEYIANQNLEWNGNPITTEAEYNMALYEQELTEKGVSPEEITRLVSEHPEVRKAREIAEQNARNEDSTREFREFVAEYPQVKPEEIPVEVFQYQNQTGKSLVDCMRWNENRLLKEQVKTLSQNLENAKKAPVGSVTALGNEGTEYDPFLDGFNS